MKIITLPLCLGFMSINSCNFVGVHGSGVAKTETRSVASFSKIDLAGSPDVEVTVGPARSVVITADDNILPIIETKVVGDTLKIGSRGSYNTSIGVKLKIELPTLDGAFISGSGNIQAKGLKGGDMEAQVTGSGNITLSGSAAQLHARITGSGNVEAKELSAKEVDATITGSGNASVNATENLEARVTGSGDVRYSGKPAHIQKNIVGSGNIEPR